MISLFLFGASMVITFFKRNVPSSRKVLGHQVLTRDGYDHCVLEDSQGVFLAYINAKRFAWYIRKGLALQTSEDTIRLNFVPAGSGNKDDPFYSQKVENICVCCGTDDNYTKHHVIPDEFRIHFPLHMKSNSSHDLVLLCAKCHEEYETIAMDFKKELSIKYDIPLGGLGAVQNPELKRIQKLCSALIKFWNQEKIPIERMEDMKEDVKKYLGTETISIEKCSELVKIENVDTSNYRTFGECLVEKIAGKDKNVENIEEFGKMWRHHFVEIMKPEFVSKGWDRDRSVSRKSELLK